MHFSLSGLFLAMLAASVMGSGVGYSKIYLFHVLLILFCIAWFVMQLNGRGYIFYKPRSLYIYFWIFFFAWYVLGVNWSLEPVYTLRYLFYIGIGVLLIYLINSYIDSVERYQQVFNVLKVMFIVAIGLALLEAFTPFRLPTSSYSQYAGLFGREAINVMGLEPSAKSLIKSAPTAFWGNPNNLSVAMVILAPFFLLTKDLKWRVIGLISIFIIIIMAGSRGSFIALVFGIAVYVCVRGYKYIFTALFLSILLSLLLVSNFDSLKNSENSRIADIAWAGEALYIYIFEQEESMNSIGARQQLIRNGLDALWQTNGLGVGGGGSQAVQEEAGGVAGTLRSMHNFWVEVLVEAGIVMFSFFVIWYLSLAFKLYRIYKAAKYGFYKYQAGSLFLALMIFVVACVSASSVIYLFSMWLMFAMSIAVVRLYNKEKLLGANS